MARFLPHPCGGVQVRARLRGSEALPSELIWRPTAPAAKPPKLVIYSEVPRTSGDAAQALHGLGTWAATRLPIVHVATPWLWDAVATAIIRQVIRAKTARALWDRFCFHDETEWAMGARLTPRVPSPEDVLGWPCEKFSRLGLKFKRPALVSAAEALRNPATMWPSSPPDLVRALQEIPHVGPWTAGVAAADVTGDYSVYPVGDLAVRHWAQVSQPSFSWARDEAGFRDQWEKLTGPQLGFWTICALGQGGVLQ